MTQFQQKCKEEKEDESKYLCTQKLNSITFKLHSIKVAFKWNLISTKSIHCFHHLIVISGA
jgi:hypothetical protein